MTHCLVMSVNFKACRAFPMCWFQALCCGRACAHTCTGVCVTTDLHVPVSISQYVRHTPYVESVISMTWKPTENTEQLPTFQEWDRCQISDMMLSLAGMRKRSIYQESEGACEHPQDSWASSASAQRVLLDWPAWRHKSSSTNGN